MKLQASIGNTLVDRVLQHAIQRSHALAIATPHRAWTWGELADEVDRVALAPPLNALPRGAAFGWLGVNTVAMLVMLLACSRLGLRFVPLNWRLAAPELQAVALHAGLAAWHADEGFTALDGWSSVQNTPASSAPGEQHHDDLMLAYTSGSTGEAKGALHTQAAMLANIDAAIDALVLDMHSRSLAVLPMFHVGGLCVHLLPVLAAGGVVNLHERFDPGAWLDDVAAWRPNTAVLVPAMMRAVVEHPRWATADLSSLQAIAAGSSIVPLPLIDAFHARGVLVQQVYGATETGPITLVLRRNETKSHAGSVGFPAKGVQVKVVEGELWVRAPNVARGYHRRPNDDAFAEGWFHTGDLATVDAEGRHTIVGRSKEMIISGGENIYPAEIENLALADPAVADAAVVGMPDARWGEVPVLALVARPGVPVDIVRLQTTFSNKLARFKHPKHIVVLSELPKTALGKIARAVLAKELLVSLAPTSGENPKT